MSGINPDLHEPLGKRHGRIGKTPEPIPVIGRAEVPWPFLIGRRQAGAIGIQEDVEEDRKKLFAGVKTVIVEVLLPAKTVSPKNWSERAFEAAKHCRERGGFAQDEEEMEMIGHDHEGSEPPVAAQIQCMRFRLERAGDRNAGQSRRRALQATGDEIVGASL